MAAIANAQVDPAALTVPGRRAEPAPPRRILGRVALYTVLILAAAALFLPFYWMAVSSLKHTNEVFTAPVHWLPSTVVWHNYLDIWQKAQMSTWLRNTLFLSVVVTFLQVLTGSFAAYGFSKIRFRGRELLFLAYIGTIAVPWQSYMIPQFILFSRIKLTNTLWSIVALQAFGAFGVFLMKQFFESIPEELSEAARIDGLSEYGIWRRIMLPLSMPAVASLSLLTFVTTWNDYLGPLLYLRDPGVRTIQLGLSRFIDAYNAEYSLIMTGSVLSVIPIAIIFALGQRYFVEGIATTGLKG
ncbi:MAG TPA: carbohydrate ABC transporter permease [Micromonosporaceae bacterium]|jgi:multiple sugar transport system permease protein